MAGEKMNKALAGLQGGLNLLQNFEAASAINDTSNIAGQINQLGSIGGQGVDTFMQLADEYRNASFTPEIDYDAIRGMNTGQQVLSTGSSVLTGAASGATIGGVPGAIVGGLIGLGTGLAGIFNGNAKARAKVRELQTKAAVAQDTAMANLGAAHERLLDTNFRNRSTNIAAEGGQIERRKQSIKEYAERVMKKPVTRERVPSSIVSKHCNGGTMIRLKTK